jgi:starch synthase
VVIVSSEVEPWSKSGGLAIVAGAYGYEFAMRGHKTMVVSPMYDDYPNVSWVADKDMQFWDGTQRIKFYHTRKVHDEATGAATDFVFVSHSSFRRPGGLYNDKNGEYGDNLFRFSLFALASLEAPLCCNIDGSTYGDRCLFLANDWQAGLVPVFMVHKFRRNGTYKDARCIFVVHNMGYQGAYPWDDSHLGRMSLPGTCRDDLFFVYPEHMRVHALDKGECVNLTKGGLITSDRVLTVSKNYAQEIQTVEGGFLLQDVCRMKGVYVAGIQNGIEDTWDPTTDRLIAAKYSSADMSGKAACKKELQASLGLCEDPEVALIGFVGRLTWQKGIDILQEGVIEWLMKDDGNGVTGHAQLVLMGNGDAQLSDWLKTCEAQYKGRVCGYAGFDPKVERKMMAGCDFLLMPSRYEPCGIPQMVALAYGTVPIVHATGGLKDSVVDVASAPESGKLPNGYHVSPLRADKMKEVFWKALSTFIKDKPEHERLMKNGMSCDFYWPQAIQEYERHFDYTFDEPPLYKI